MISEIRNLKSEISFQDIYVPNGQLQGHVTPPDPIQQAFGHGTWELANADWEPDFPTASKDIRWFLDKGKEINPDILGIVNLTTIKKVLDVVGNFSVPEYQASLTPDNLYLFLQGKTEVNFFPGSTQKKDTLTAVGTAMLKKINTLSLSKKIKIAKILYNDLSNQNIVLNSLNPNFQSILEQKKFAGILTPKAFDNYALIETNLGANKSNQFVKRQTTHEIKYGLISNNSLFQSNSPTPEVGDTTTIQGITHQVNIKFTNSSPEANPNPPLYYGGNYITYLRIYIPSLAQNINLSGSPIASPSSFIISNTSPSPSPTVGADPRVRPASNTAIQDSSKQSVAIAPGLSQGASGTILTNQIITQPLSPSLRVSDTSEPKQSQVQNNSTFHSSTNPLITPKYGFTEIGFWHITPAGGESTLNLSYDLPLIDQSDYSLAILKQNGFPVSPQTIHLFGKPFTSELTSSYLFP